MRNPEPKSKKIGTTTTTTTTTTITSTTSTTTTPTTILSNPIYPFWAELNTFKSLVQTSELVPGGIWGCRIRCWSLKL